MTLESDKLPAVAGIVTRIHEVTGSDYIAGLAKEGAISLGAAVKLDIWPGRGLAIDKVHADTALRTQWDLTSGGRLARRLRAGLAKRRLSVRLFAKLAQYGRG
jgi:hypothetical protein